jgi:hypothetical protein
VTPRGFHFDLRGDHRALRGFMSSVSKSCFCRRRNCRQVRRGLRPPPSGVGLPLAVLLPIWGAAHVLPALLRSAAALGNAGADEVALNIGESAKYRQDQAPGAGAGVGPRLGPRSKLRLGVHDLLHDGEKVKGAACETVYRRPPYRQGRGA